MKAFHIVLIVLIGTLALSSCGGGNTPDASTAQTPEKTPYKITTESIGSLSQQIKREQNATITASSHLTLTAQTSGEVSSVNFHEGQAVRAGAAIVSLRDTLSNTDLAVVQARNGITLQDASITTTTVNLDQAITAAQAAYDRARLTYESLTSKTSLQYSNTLKQNNTTLRIYQDNYTNFLNELDRLMTQLLHEGDQILGMTAAYEHTNDAWEPYLGARWGDALKKAQDAWNIVYSTRGDIRAQMEKTPVLNGDDPDAAIQLGTRGYEVLRNYTDAMVYMIQNNVLGGPLPTELNSAWTMSWNNFRTAIGGSEQSYTAWKSQTQSFFRDHNNNAEAVRLATERLSRPLTGEEMRHINENPDLKLAYENTQIDLDNNIAQAKLAMEQAEKSLEDAKKLRDATLKQLSAGRANAELALTQAQRAASRLVVSAPVNGVVTKVLVQKGQNVSMGTPVAEFSGNEPQALVEIDPRLARLLPPNTPVQAKMDDGTLIDGVVTASSPVANNNLLSSVRMSFPEAGEHIGQPVTIIFSFDDALMSSKSILLPIKAVRIIAEGEGEVALYVNGTIEYKNVRLGAMYGTNIEVFSDLSSESEIILSDVSGYNAQKNILQK